MLLLYSQYLRLTFLQLQQCLFFWFPFFLRFPVIFFGLFIFSFRFSPPASSSLSNFSSIWGQTLLICNNGFSLFLATPAPAEASSFPMATCLLIILAGTPVWLSSVLPPALHLAQSLLGQASLSCWISLWQPTVSGSRRHCAEPELAGRVTEQHLRGLIRPKCWVATPPPPPHPSGEEREREVSKSHQQW